MDLWLAAARLNTLLALGSHARGLRGANSALAAVFARLVLEVHDTPVKTFAPGTEHEHDMLQVWVANALSADAVGVRFKTRWQAGGSFLQVTTEPGLWMKVLRSDMGNYTLGAEEEVDLHSNGAVQHAGVMVKYRSDSDAYVVTPVGFHRLMNETRSWRHNPKALGPGVYNVDLAFRARQGRRTVLRFKVTNQGPGGSLSAELVTGRVALSG